jgi:hypothetical protein
MERVVVIHDEAGLSRFKDACPLTFDESVFDRDIEGVEDCRPPDSTLGCIFHIFIPPKIMAALAAKNAGIVGHRSGKIDDSVALLTCKERQG